MLGVFGGLLCNPLKTLDGGLLGELAGCMAKPLFSLWRVQVWRVPPSTPLARVRASGDALPRFSVHSFLSHTGEPVMKC